MKNVLLWLLLTTMLAGAGSLKSAEIIPVWNTKVNGDIQDIEFMPGGEQFMLTTGLGEIQIRSSVDGELVRSHIDQTNLFMNGYFEFTPDSTRVVMAISGLMQLIDIQSFERIKYFAFGPDSIAKGFSDIILDPIRPYAYVTLKGWEKTSGSNIPRCKVQVYNYETMQLVKDLTPYGEDEYTAIKVSHDGKYLATLNDNKAYLKVWNLETMELVINVPLFDENSTDWCRAEDIYFSKLDENVIYISGFFNKQINDKRKNGIFRFDINERKRNRVIPDGLYDGYKMIFLNNETKIVNTDYSSFSVVNLTESTLDLNYNLPNNIYTTIVKYFRQGNYFVGASNNKLSKFLYDSQSSVNNTIEDELLITPNPTNSLVNINLNCTEPIISYSIYDTNGILLKQATTQNQNNTLQFDFTPYPSGVYFLTLNCNNQAKTYKVIKEN